MSADARVEPLAIKCHSCTIRKVAGPSPQHPLNVLDTRVATHLVTFKSRSQPLGYCAQHVKYYERDPWGVVADITPAPVPRASQ